MLKITLKPNQKLWFTSDTHYGHSNICSATTKWLDSKGNIPPNVRKFDSLDKMNDILVYNINSLVKEDDILFHMGDWSFGGFDNIKKFRERIVCKNIYIITGNHDHHILNNKNNIRDIFSGVFEHYTQIEVKYSSIKSMGEFDEVKIIACHYPIASWENMAKGWIHLFGHVHLPPQQRIMLGKAMDVGVDGNRLFPVSFSDIIKLLKNNPKKPLTLPSDHHDDEWTEIKN